MERRKRGGGALSQCQFLGILIIGAADATPGFLEAVTSFSIIIQFCNVQVLEESRKIIICVREKIFIGEINMLMNMRGRSC